MPYTILWRFYREKSINVRLKNKNSPNIPGRTSRSPLHTVRKHKAAIFACHTLPAEPCPGKTRALIGQEIIILNPDLPRYKLAFNWRAKKNPLQKGQNVLLSDISNVNMNPFILIRMYDFIILQAVNVSADIGQSHVKINKNCSDGVVLGAGPPYFG